MQGISNFSSFCNTSSYIIERERKFDSPWISSCKCERPSNLIVENVGISKLKAMDFRVGAVIHSSSGHGIFSWNFDKLGRSSLTPPAFVGSSSHRTLSCGKLRQPVWIPKTPRMSSVSKTGILSLMSLKASVLIPTQSRLKLLSFGISSLFFVSMDMFLKSIVSNLLPANQTKRITTVKGWRNVQYMSMY